ncbi:MAG: DUF1648 domain-containing protein [Bacteroidota bacterium]
MLLRRRDKNELPRPVIRFEMGPADWILEGLSIVALLSFFGFILYQYHLLPDTIPTHFNATGTPDDYGRKDTLWALPFVTLIIYTVLTVISRIPEKFNFPVKITPANARVQYLLSLRLFRILKLAITLMFFYIGYTSVMISLNHADALGIWFLSVFLAAILIPIVIYFILAMKNK